MFGSDIGQVFFHSSHAPPFFFIMLDVWGKALWPVGQPPFLAVAVGPSETVYIGQSLLVNMML